MGSIDKWNFSRYNSFSSLFLNGEASKTSFLWPTFVNRNTWLMIPVKV